MAISMAPQIIVLLSVLAGALHVLGPDHWLPTSVLAWQKGWGFSKTFFFSIAVFFSHVFSGYLLFLAFQRGMHTSGSTRWFFFAVLLILSIAIFRRFRFSRVQDIFRVGHQGARGSFSVLAFLGPSEATVPIFIKAKFLGIGYLIPFAAFLLGTWIAGVFLVTVGRLFWDRPSGLSRGIDWWYRGRTVLPAALPMTAGLMLNLGFLYLF